jgi:hypothetical protein
MRFKTTGRAAWILAAGLCASAFLSPAAAQDAAQAPDQPAAVGSATGVTAAPAQPIRLHPKKSASKSRKAERQAKARKPAKEETVKAEELKPTQDDAMSPAVANANAQWANEAKPTDTYNMSAQAGTVLSQMGAQTEPHANAATADSTHGDQLVAADQLNELDRAISDDKVHDTANDKPALTLASATIDAPVVVSQSNSATLDQTSLIGKIFIAFGGLLTLASAARMFIA